MNMRHSDDYAQIKIIGIPRALLYYRYGVLWKTFFKALGFEVVLSDTTDKPLVDKGISLSVDECCLASKTFMGHIANLQGRCDAVFVPSYASANPRAGFCTKFQSAPDLVSNTFRDEEIKVLSLLVEDVSNEKQTRKAFLSLADTLKVRPSVARRAWKRAVREQKAYDDVHATMQAKTLRLLDEYRKVVASDPTQTEEAPIAILLAAHPYIAHDHYLGGAVTDALEELGVTILYANETDHAKAYKASLDFSETLPWTINREIIGSILLLKDKIDGIVLVSAFPCGPDSMTNDAIMRCIHGIPILNLMIDAQSGTAGIQTRVESFVDIIRFKQKKGYLRD